MSSLMLQLVMFLLYNRTLQRFAVINRARPTSKTLLTPCSSLKFYELLNIPWFWNLSFTSPEYHRSLRCLGINYTLFC